MLNKLTKSVGACLLTLSLAACSDTPRYQPLAAESVVLAFGDSVTYGTGAAQREDYPTHLAQKSGWKIVNAGIPGDTAGAAKSRIASALAETNPALVIIELGGNDFLRRRTETEVKEDLRSIVQAVKQAGATPVLVAVPAVSLVSWGLADAQLYAALAEEEGALLIEDVFSKVLADPALRADPIHPNAQGYRVLAAGIGNALHKAGLLAKH